MQITTQEALGDDRTHGTSIGRRAIVVAHAALQTTQTVSVGNEEGIVEEGGDEEVNRYFPTSLFD